MNIVIKEKTRVTEYLFVFALVLFIAITYLNIQPQIVAGGGYGWDGQGYHKIFMSLSSSSIEVARYPFCNRIGLPFLTTLTGISNDILGFKIINTISSIIFSMLIYHIAKSVGLNTYYSLFSLALTIIPFFSPIRFIPYYPEYTDPPFLAILSIAFFHLISNKFIFSLIMLIIAFPFREISIYLIPCFFMASIYMDGISKRKSVYFVLAMITALTMKYIIQEKMNCHGSQISSALSMSLRRINDPVMMMKYIAAISMTAAPLIYIRQSTLSPLEKISIAGFFISAFFAFVGGIDATRIFYSFFPIYFLAIMMAIKANGYVFSIFCLAGFALSNSFGAIILEPLNFIPVNDESGFFWQFPDHARPEVALNILCVWIILFLVYEKLFRNHDGFHNN